MKTRCILTRLACGIATVTASALASASPMTPSEERERDANFVLTVTAPSLDYRSAALPHGVGYDVLLDRASADNALVVASLASVQEESLNAAIERVLTGFDLSRD